MDRSRGLTQWRTHVVGDSRSGVELSGAFAGFPDTKKLDKEVVGEASVHHLANEEDVRRESRLEHDGHVGCVEETDGVGTAHSSLSAALDWDFDTKSLEVDHGSKHDQCSQEVHDVGQVLPVECFTESSLLVRPCKEEMEERNNSPLKFGSSAGIDGRWRESLPDDRFADIGGDE